MPSEPTGGGMDGGAWFHADCAVRESARRFGRGNPQVCLFLAGGALHALIALDRSTNWMDCRRRE